MIKRILMVIILIVFLFPLTASATWYLASDIPAGNPTGATVNVDGVDIDNVIFAVSTDGQSLLLIDATPYIDGQVHTYIACFTYDDMAPGCAPPFVPGVGESPVLRLIQQ